MPSTSLISSNSCTQHACYVTGTARSTLFPNPSVIAAALLLTPCSLVLELSLSLHVPGKPTHTELLQSFLLLFNLYLQAGRLKLFCWHKAKSSAVLLSMLWGGPLADYVRFSNKLHIPPAQEEDSSLSDLTLRPVLLLINKEEDAGDTEQVVLGTTARKCGECSGPAYEPPENKDFLKPSVPPLTPAAVAC